MPGTATKSPPPLTPVLQSSSSTLLTPWRRKGFFPRPGRGGSAARGEPQLDAPMEALAVEGHQPFLGPWVGHVNPLLPSPREEDEDEPDLLALLGSVASENTMEGKLRKLLRVRVAVQGLLINHRGPPLPPQSSPQDCDAEGPKPCSSSLRSAADAAAVENANFQHQGLAQGSSPSLALRRDFLEVMSVILLQEPTSSRGAVGSTIPEEGGDSVDLATVSQEFPEAGTGEPSHTEVLHFGEVQVIVGDILADLCRLNVEVVGACFWSTCRRYLEDPMNWQRCLLGLELLTHMSTHFSSWLLRSTDAIMWLVRILTDTQQSISQQRETTLAATGRSTAGQAVSRLGPLRSAVDVFACPSPSSLGSRLPAGRAGEHSSSSLMSGGGGGGVGVGGAGVTGVGGGTPIAASIHGGRPPLLPGDQGDGEGCNARSAQPMRVPPLNLGLAARTPGGCSSIASGYLESSPIRRMPSSMTRSSRRLRERAARETGPSLNPGTGSSLSSLGQRTPGGKLGGAGAGGSKGHSAVVPSLGLRFVGGSAVATPTHQSSPVTSPHAAIAARSARSGRASIQQADALAKALGEACLLGDLSHLIKYKQERQVQEAVIDSIRPGGLSPGGAGTGRPPDLSLGACPSSSSTALPKADGAGSGGNTGIAAQSSEGRAPSSESAGTSCAAPTQLGGGLSPQPGWRTVPNGLSALRLPGISHVASSQPEATSIAGAVSPVGSPQVSHSADGLPEARPSRFTALRQARLHACLVLEQFVHSGPDAVKFVGPHIPVNKFFEMLQGSCGRSGVCSFAIDDDLESEVRIQAGGGSSTVGSDLHHIRGLLPQRLSASRSQKLARLQCRLQRSATSSRCICGASALGTRSRSGTIDDVCTCVDDVLAESIWRLLGTRVQYIETLWAPKVAAPRFHDLESCRDTAVAHQQPPQWDQLQGAWHIRLGMDGFLTRASHLMGPLLLQLRSTQNNTSAGQDAVAALQHRLSFTLRLCAAYLRRSPGRALELHAFHVLAPVLMALKSHLCSTAELIGPSRLPASDVQLWISYIQLVGAILVGGVRSGADFSFSLSETILVCLMDCPQSASAVGQQDMGVGSVSTTIGASGISYSQSSGGTSSASLASPAAGGGPLSAGGSRGPPGAAPPPQTFSKGHRRLPHTQSPRTPATLGVTAPNGVDSLDRSATKERHSAPPPPKGLSELLPRILERTVFDSSFEDSLAAKPCLPGGVEDSAETMRCRVFSFVESLLSFCQALLCSLGPSGKAPATTEQSEGDDEEEVWQWSRRSGSPTVRIQHEDLQRSLTRSPPRRLRSSSAGSLTSSMPGASRVAIQRAAEILVVGLLDWMQFLFLPPSGLLCRTAQKVPLTGSTLGTRLVLCERALFTIPAIQYSAFLREQQVADFYVRRHFLAFVRLYNGKAMQASTYDRKLTRTCCLHLQTLLAIASLQMDVDVPRRAFHQLSVIDFLVGEIDLEHETSQMHQRFLRTAHVGSSAGSSNAGSRLSSSARTNAPLRWGGSMAPSTTATACQSPATTAVGCAAVATPDARRAKERATSGALSPPVPAMTLAAPQSPQAGGMPLLQASRGLGKVPKLQFKGLRPSLQGCTGLGAPPPEEPGLPETMQLKPSQGLHGTMEAVPEAALAQEASVGSQGAPSKPAPDDDDLLDSSDEDDEVPATPAAPAGPALPDGPVLRPPEASAAGSPAVAGSPSPEERGPEQQLQPRSAGNNACRTVPKLSFQGLQPKTSVSIPAAIERPVIQPQSHELQQQTADPSLPLRQADDQPTDFDSSDEEDESPGSKQPQPQPPSSLQQQSQPQPLQQQPPQAQQSQQQPQQSQQPQQPQLLQPLTRLRAVPKLSFKGLRPSMQGCSGLGLPPPEEPGAYPDEEAQNSTAAQSTTASPIAVSRSVATMQLPLSGSECGDGNAMTPTVSSSGCQSPHATDGELSFKGVVNQHIFYFTGRQRRRLYQDTELHALVLTLIIALLVTPKKGLLDLRYCDQYPLANNKRNIPYLLSLHVNHPANRAVLSPLVRNVETITHIGGVRVLKLLCEAAMHRWMYADWTRIAGGSFGTVYQCSVPLGEPWIVAVKQIPKQSMIQDRCVFHDVLNEVVCLDTIRFEDHLCQLYDFGVDETGYWIVMRYYPTTLKKWRESMTGSMSENLPTLLAIFRQVLQAVQLLHSRNIVHYDLKCDNIMLDVHSSFRKRSCSSDDSVRAAAASGWGSDGSWHLNSLALQRQVSRAPSEGGTDWSAAAQGVPRIAVADFGESLMLADEGELDTKNRGTELVKCPEMLELEKVGRKEGFNFDRRRRVGTNRAADVWSVGCLLFELLTGRFLFQDDGFGNFWARVTGHMGNTEDNDVISQANSRLLEGNAPLIHLLHFILIRHPEGRPSIDAVVDKFESLAAEAVQWVGADTSEAEDAVRDDGVKSPHGVSETPRSAARSMGSSSEGGAHHVAKPGLDNSPLSTTGAGGSHLTKVLHNLSVLDASSDDAHIPPAGETNNQHGSLRALLAQSLWSHVIDCRLQSADALPCEPEELCRLQLPWSSPARSSEELVSFLPTIFDFLRHASITRGIVLLVDSHSSPATMGGPAAHEAQLMYAHSAGHIGSTCTRGGVAMAVVLALVAEVRRMAIYPALSYLSSQVLVPAVRSDIVLALAKWQEGERSPIWRRCETSVRVSCMCGACSWHLPRAWLQEAACRVQGASTAWLDPKTQLTTCQCSSSSSTSGIACSSSCPARGTCESYACWFRARFGLSLQAVQWMWLPADAGDGLNYSDGPANGVLTRGMAVQAEVVTEEQSRPRVSVHSSSSRLTEPSVQRHRCRSCQVLTHATISSPVQLGAPNRVAVVLSYEQLRSGLAYEVVADAKGRSTAVAAEAPSARFHTSHHRHQLRRPPQNLRSTLLEELLLPEGGFVKDPDEGDTQGVAPPFA